MSLILRRAQAFSKLNSPQRDDFDVMDGSRRIGRVFYSETGTDRWRWCLSTAIWKAGLAGRAPTRVLALQAIDDTYNAVNILEGSDYEHKLSALKLESSARRSVRMVVNSF
jgi:hypothetical protein